MIQDEEQRNTIGATIFAVLMGLAALCLVGWVMLSGGCTDAPQASSNDDEAAPVALAPVQAPAEIEKSEAYMKLVDERDRIGNDRLEAVAKGREAEKELERLKRKFGVLEAENAANDSQAALLGTAAASAAAFKLQADNAAKRADALEGEIGTLKARISALEKAAADAKQSVEGLKGDLDKSVSAKNQLQSAKGDLEKKVAEIEAQLAEAKKIVEAKKAAAGAKGKLEKQVDTLSADLAAAKQAAADAKKALDAQTKKLNAELAVAKKAAADAAAKSKAMAGAANPSDEKTKALTAQLENLRKKMGTDSDAWSAEKQRLVKNSTALDEQKKKLTANVSKQQAEIDRLKKLLEEQKAKAAAMAAAPAPATPSQPALDFPLLVNDPSQLAAYSQPLFTKLNTIDENEASREKIYAELKAAGEVDPKLTVPFRSGSASVNSDYTRQISSLIAEAGDDAKYLVVGYASNDGSAEGNRKLSSERASNVAQQIAEKLGDQGAEHVQAIYFGQTTRFSDSRKTPNRVVEVWKVK